MNSDYLILIGGVIAAIIFIASLVYRHRRRAIFYEYPMDWRLEGYEPRKTIITADFVEKDEAA